MGTFYKFMGKWHNKKFTKIEKDWMGIGVKAPGAHFWQTQCPFPKECFSAFKWS